MSSEEHVEKTLELILIQIQDLERQAAEKKKTANDLSRILQRPVIFQSVDTSASSAAALPGEYYGRQMPEVIQAILEKRKLANLGSASVAEIYNAMIKGGYYFQTKNPDYAKRGIYGVLAGADGPFHRLPDGRYGLKQWYPAAKFKGELNGTERKNERKSKKHKKGAKRNHQTGSKRKTRLEQVRELLANGPMSRKDIRDKSGLPEGTVAYLLNEDNFKHLEDGQWDLRDEER